MPKSILYATTNDYKILAASLAIKDFEITFEKLPAGVPDVSEIQSNSQAEVAIDKALKYYELLKQPLIVMDFGFFIDDLKGFPGVYTKHTNETIGVEGIVALVQAFNNPTAYTERTIVYIDASGYKVFSSRCTGVILKEPRGTRGRHNDFIFQLDATGKTLAEMTEEEKAAQSGAAWRELGEWLQKRP